MQHAGRALYAERQELISLPLLLLQVKENNAVAGMDATIGDLALVGHPSPEDEPMVELLLQAGAIIFGKTNLPVATADWQSYNAVYGQCNNPWDLGVSPGGVN